MDQFCHGKPFILPRKFVPHSCTHLPVPYLYSAQTHVVEATQNQTPLASPRSTRHKTLTILRFSPRNYHTHSTSNSDSDNGWAKSERLRLSKALESLRVRQKALEDAEASGATASSSPTKVGGVNGVPVAGGGRKRPRPGDSGHGCGGSLGRTPSPPRLDSLSAERFEAIDER